jgi:small-conductance mechanosensitive channel
MRRLIENRFARGMAIIALVSLVIVLLSLEESLVTANALLTIAFFLAIAFFLFVMWRDRRSDIDAWSDLSRRTFYGAIILAVLAVGVYLGVGADGPESVVLIAVLAACGWAAVRVWRREHTYS